MDKHKDLNAESYALSAMFCDKEGLTIGIELLKKEDFAIREHQWIFEAIDNLFNNMSDVDVITVTNELKRLNYLDRQGAINKLTEEFILEIGDLAYSSASIKSHIQIIKDKKTTRDLIETSRGILNECERNELSSSEILDKAQLMMLNINAETTKSIQHIETVAHKTIEFIEHKIANKNNNDGIVTGIYGLNNLAGLLKSGQLIVIGAPSGHGKSILANQIAFINGSHRNKSVLIFNMEMTSEEMLIRELARQADVTHSGINDCTLDNMQIANINKVASELSSKKINIDDSSSQTISTIRAKASQVLQKEGRIDLIVVDYIQLMTPPHSINNREQQIAFLSRQLKMIAKDFKCPVLALSQLNEHGEVRESRAIENDADKLILLSQPYKQGLDSVVIDTIEIEPPPKDYCLLKLKKNRSGNTGYIDAKINGNKMMITDWHTFD